MLRLNQVLKDRNITKRSLSKMLDITPQALNSKLNAKNINKEFLKRLCNVLNCDIHELLETSGGYMHSYESVTGVWLGIRKK